MKINKRSVRRDAIEDHMHTLPDGGETLGSLIKPSQSTQFAFHTHLYQHEGKTHETGPSQDGPGHKHETLEGDTSGPKSMPTKTSFGPRNDSLMRIGSQWQVRSPDGVILNRGRTAEEACQKYDSMDTYDEAFAKSAAGVTDDETWDKAKAHSMANFGEHKWPYVQHIHKVLGGK